MKSGKRSSLYLLILIGPLVLCACKGITPGAPQPTRSVSPALATLENSLGTDDGAPPPSPLSLATSPEPVVITPSALPALTVRPTSSLDPAQSPTPGYEWDQSTRIDFGPWDHIFSLAWAPEGDLLAVGAGHKVYLYNSQDLVQVQTLDVGGWVTSLSFSSSLADGLPAVRLLAMSLRDGSVQIWDIGTTTGDEDVRPICKLETHRNGANRVAFSPYGLTMATAGNDAMVRLWDIGELLRQGSCRLSFLAEMIGGARSVPDIAYSPDGFNLAMVDLHMVRIRDVSTQRLVTTFRAEESLTTIAYNASGELLASAGIGDSIQIWDVPTGQVRQTLRLAPQASSAGSIFMWDVAFNPAGDLLVAATSDGRLYVWEIGEEAPEEPLHAMEGHTRSVTCVAFSPDGRTLASGSLDATLRLWPVELFPSK